MIVDKVRAAVVRWAGGEPGRYAPYQNLINLYLRECAAEKKRLKLDWAA